MHNFHYAGISNNPKNEKSVKLLEQLKMIDRQLEQDHKKLAEKKKLQDEFYEDSNRMNLADEVMNQLLNKKPQPNQRINYAPTKPENNVDPMRLYSPPAHQVNFLDQKNNFNAVVKQKQPAKPIQFVNKRQLQKMKLQNQNAQQQFPFGGHSREKQRKVKLQNDYAPTRISPERQYPVKNNYMANDIDRPRFEQQPPKVENPFVRNDLLLKQKRQQQQKQYRKLLEQQMQQQKRRKQAQKQKYKEQIQQKFNSYTPTSNQQPQIKTNQIGSNVPENNFKKRRDPNAQYTSLQKPASQIRPSDIEYLRMQVQTLKSKLKKGRINFEQYDQQIKKLQLHYKCKVQDIQDSANQPIKKNDSGEQQYDNANADVANSEQQRNQSRPLEQLEKRQNVSSLSRNRNNVSAENPQFDNHYNNTSVPLQHMRPQPYQNYSNYHQSPVQVPNPQADFQMQMMFKILDEFKSIFKMQTQTYSTDKKVLQQALTKMIPVANPIMMTQQIPPNQLPPQKQFFTQAKKVERFDNFPRNNIPGIDYSTPHQSQSQISSSYIEKSMSGIVNKIPLTKKQKQEQKGDSGKDLQKFYSRKYKFKKFKGFEYKQVDNQSSLVIPSVSNFLQTKNSQNQLSQAFEKDLKNYKRLEKQRQMVIMVEKIKKSKSGDLKSSPKKINQGSEATNNKQRLVEKVESKFKMPIKQVQHQVNPFLKKHISSQSNQAHEVQQLSKPKQVNSKNIQSFTSPNPKNEILEQQQYETEPRKVQSPRKQQKIVEKRNELSTYQSQAVKNNTGKDHPSSKLMNIMKTNNQILAKYEMTPPHNPNHHIGSNSLSSIKEIIRADSSKELSSREYFSGHQISPVQRRQYESSLQTVRSQQQSAKYERKNNMDLLVMGSAGQSSNFSQDYQPRNMMSPYPAHASPTIQSIQIQRRNQVSRNPYEYENVPNITGYSQTVQSISESSSRLPSFNKPPNSNNGKKNGRTVSRKKESVVKLGQSGESFQKSGLSGIPSQGSREKSSGFRDINIQDNTSNMEAPKFDSAVYESAYQQSREDNPSFEVKRGQQKKQNERNPQNMIQFPKINKQILGNDSSFSKLKQNMPHQSSLIREQKQQVTSAAPKLRSLQQARKIAREYKQRAGEEHNRSSVQEKLSQLQSIIQQTNKKDDSLLRNRREQPPTTNKKSDIMKILDGLQQQDQYSPDFESYKQQSEK